LILVKKPFKTKEILILTLIKEFLADICFICALTLFLFYQYNNNNVIVKMALGLKFFFFKNNIFFLNT